MPPAVRTSSPGLRAPSISACFRCWARCGRISRKYRKANIARRTRKKPLPTRNLLAWRCGGLLEAVEGRRLVCGELTSLDRRPRLSRQVEQESDVVLGQKYQAEELLLVDEMAQVRPAEAAARRTGAIRVQRLRVAGKTRVFQIQASLPGERRAGPAEASGQHAVEHVDSTGDDLQNACRIPDPHEVARPVGRQERCRPRDGLEHRSALLSHAEPAERVAVEAERRQLLDRATTKLGIGSALCHAEQELAVSARRSELPL